MERAPRTSEDTQTSGGVSRTANASREAALVLQTSVAVGEAEMTDESWQMHGSWVGRRTVFPPHETSPPAGRPDARRPRRPRTQDFNGPKAVGSRLPGPAKPGRAWHGAGATSLGRGSRLAIAREPGPAAGFGRGRGPGPIGSPTRGTKRRLSGRHSESPCVREI